MHVTVVIVTHQSAGTLDACLRPLAGLRDVSVRVIDNASTDDSLAIARRHGVEVVAIDRNLGFAAAANRGAAGIGEGLVCFLNPDCLLTAEAVEEARRVLADRPTCCAVPEFEQWGTTVPGRQPGYTWRKVLADLLEDNRRLRPIRRWLRAHPRHHDHGWHWPLGTCLFVPAALFHAVAGFDERYFLYMEDVEFGLQLHRRGGEVLALPVRLTHAGMQGAAVPAARRQQLLNEARILFARIHHGPLVAAWASLLARP